MNKRVKQIFASFMLATLLTTMGLSTAVSAASVEAPKAISAISSEAQNADVVVNLDRLDDPVYIAAVNSELSGYAHRVTGTGQGSFNVYVTGSTAVLGGVTFRSDCDTDDALTVVDIQRPNGGYLFTNGSFPANSERHYGFYLATSGTYKVYYATYADTNPVHLQIWIYKKS